MCDLFTLNSEGGDGDSEVNETKELVFPKSEDKSVSPGAAKDDGVTLDRINEVYTELQKWADMSDSKV